MYILNVLVVHPRHHRCTVSLSVSDYINLYLYLCTFFFFLFCCYKYLFILALVKPSSCPKTTSFIHHLSLPQNTVKIVQLKVRHAQIYIRIFYYYFYNNTTSLSLFSKNIFISITHSIDFEKKKKKNAKFSYCKFLKTFQLLYMYY